MDPKQKFFLNMVAAVATAIFTTAMILDDGNKIIAAMSTGAVVFFSLSAVWFAGGKS